MEAFLNCQSCKKRFNTGKREPVMLFCCGKTCCKECFATMNTKSEDGAEEIFKCKMCSSDKYVGHRVNEHLREQLEQITTSALVITCDAHPYS